MNEVIARIARVFFDDSLPTNAAFAVTLERGADGSIKDSYANLYFFRKIGGFVKPVLADLAKKGSSSWRVSLVADTNSSPLKAKAWSRGMPRELISEIESDVYAAILPHIQGVKGRGRPQTREIGPNGKPIRKRSVLPGQSVVVKPVLPAEPKKLAQPRVQWKNAAVRKAEEEARQEREEAERNSEDLDSHIPEIDGPKPKVEAPAADPFRNLVSTENYLRKVYERPTTAFSQNVWALVWRNYKDRLCDEFKAKYMKQLEGGAHQAHQVFGAVDLLEVLIPSTLRM